VAGGGLKTSTKIKPKFTDTIHRSGFPSVDDVILPRILAPMATLIVFPLKRAMADSLKGLSTKQHSWR
jgi:hypothetical protein